MRALPLLKKSRIVEKIQGAFCYSIHNEMFDSLFGDDDMDTGSGASGDTNQRGRPPGSPPPRNSTRFAGIDNQGATCYLNSLLQTLVLTPELRESLFQLGPEELGSLSDIGVPGAKVRVIPIQLQRLFARLLYLNQESCSSKDLTDSFGWNSSEHVQQHDVQELNRILFSAIEDSLIGTTGETAISELYHGSVVNQIVCQKCGRVSEREEDFLDLTLPITGMVGVSDSLRSLYSEVELMNGSNQYRCSTCRLLVDAKKGAKVRKLPPILTLSLLRFSYDFQRGERYKETSHYTFPLELDMKPYCEQVLDEDESTYELFSVVIHSGSSHGGHYHAYIRDVEGVGNWTSLVNAPITLKSDPDEGKVDFIKINSPQQLIKTLLRQHGDNHSLPLDNLCQVLLKETGVSWNKRFKKQYGPFKKFLAKYDDLFILNPANSNVSLRDPFSCEPSIASSTRAVDAVSSEERGKNATNSENSPAKYTDPQQCLPTPEHGHCWFDFNDARVHAIHESTIQTQFAGRESAYMLFYRKKMRRREDGVIQVPPVFPPWLAEEIQEANEDLRIQREIHDLSVNEVKIKLLESDHYEWSLGALQVKESVSVEPKCLSLDRRRTIADLKKAIDENYGSVLPSSYSLHIAKQLPAGLHLFDCVSGSESSILRDVGVTDGSMLFMWDGEEVDGNPIRTGIDAQPILLRLSFLDQGGEHRECYRGYPRDMTMEGLFHVVAVLADIDESQLLLQRMARNGQLTNLKRGPRSIFVEGLEDADRLVAERGHSSMSEVSAPSPVGVHNEVFLTVENRCGCQGLDHTWPSINIGIDRSKTVYDLKKMILESYFNVNSGPDSVRLRVEDDNLGLQPPLHEQQTVDGTCIKQNSHLVLEAGLPPKNNEITVTFALNMEKGESQTWELQIGRSESCQKCLERAVAAVNLQHSDYHLCKTNWCMEEQSIITDMGHSLEQECIQDGDRLLLKEGQLPPKGYIRCPVRLHPTPRRGFLQGSSVDTERTPLLQRQSEEILASVHNSAQCLDTNDITHHALLGDMEVSMDARMEEVKQQVMTLPLLTGISLPSGDFLRVRLIERGRLGKVLSGNQTLKQLKVTGTSQLAVQILAQEEKLKASEILLCICQRIPDTRTYTPPEEYIWGTVSGASPENLRRALSLATSIPESRLVLAKRLPEKWEWLEILSSSVLVEKKQAGKKGKKKGKPPEVNLKQGPYNIRDGDVVAVKDAQYDPLNRDDFSTEEDDIGRAELQQEVDEKKKLRKEKKSFNKGGATPRNSRVEVGLSIKVEDFSR